MAFDYWNILHKWLENEPEHGMWRKTHQQQCGLVAVSNHSLLLCGCDLEKEDTKSVQCARVVLSPLLVLLVRKFWQKGVGSGPLCPLNKQLLLWCGHFVWSLSLPNGFVWRCFTVRTWHRPHETNDQMLILKNIKFLQVWWVDLADEQMKYAHCQ